MSYPLIGITVHPKTAPDRADLDILLEGIIHGVERAGGSPLLVPLGLGEGTLRNLYTRLDGLLLAGGGDIDPARYGAQMHESMDGVDVDRDRIEFALARWVTEDNKPFFGICRGLQVLNVARSGALYRDISEHPSAIRHTYSSPDYPNDFRPHEVKIEEDSTLARIIGQPIITVNSLHHQACKEIAPGLRATALAPDGIVEAVEIPHHPFALAVQWHPECLPDAPEMSALFEAFVEAAKAFK